MQSQEPASCLMNLVSSRYSCRSYRPDPVPRGYIEKMLEAARLAPSSCNRQPWRFAVVTDAQLKQTLISSGFMPGLSMDWAAGAPVLIVMGMKRSLLTHRVAPLLSKIDYAWMDIGIAGEHLVLQAEELGLGTCWIGWIKPGAVRRVLDWPRDVRPAIIFTVGYPEEGALLNRTGRMAMPEIVRWYE